MFEKIFGMDQKKKAKKLGASDWGAVMCLGGHKAHPQPALSEIFFYEDRFELEPYHISVQYSKIKDIITSSKFVVTIL